MIHSMIFRVLFGLALPLFLHFSSVVSNQLEFGVQSSTSRLPNPSGLRVGFYQYTCPNAEAIVRDEMTKIISQVPSLAGPLLRMHFHDCFVNVRVIILFCSELFQLCSDSRRYVTEELNVLCCRAVMVLFC
jgi:peroxidase